MGLMENTECHATQHQLLQSGMTMGSNDDHIHTLLVSVIGDCIGRTVAFQ